MKNIIDIKTGLPENLIGTEPLLEQYKINGKSADQSGTKLFDDGTIYTSVKLGREGGGSYKWKYFTRLKETGIQQIKELIRNEFLLLKQESLPEPTSENLLIWKSFLDEKSHLIKVASGLYLSLPPVFLKIDETINQSMYKMAENPRKE